MIKDHSVKAIHIQVKPAAGSDPPLMFTPSIGALIISLVFKLQAVDGGIYNSEVKDLFIRTEQIYRLSKEKQKDSVRALYEEMYIKPNPKFRYSEGITIESSSLSIQYTPEELLLGLGANWRVWHAAALARCRSILLNNQDLLTEIVREDLRSRSNLYQVLRAASEFQLYQVIDETIEVFESTNNLDTVAAYTMIRIVDDESRFRAIQAVLQKDPNNPAKFSGALRHLLANQLAPLQLVMHLRSQDRLQRVHAAYALVDATGPFLYSALDFLIRDPDAEIRRVASEIALNLTHKGFDQAQDYALRLLADEDREVRRHVAQRLALEGNILAIWTLLLLVKSGNEKNAPEILGRLFRHTNTDFGYDTSMSPEEQDMEKISTRISQWIEENLPPGAGERPHAERMY